MWLFPPSAVSSYTEMAVLLLRFAPFKSFSLKKLPLPPRVTPPVFLKTQASSLNFGIFYFKRFCTSSLCKSANFPSKFPDFLLLAPLKPKMLITELFNHSVYAVELASDHLTLPLIVVFFPYDFTVPQNKFMLTYFCFINYL